MCLSANVSFAAAAVLLPAGALSTYRAYRVDRRYLGLAMLPALFGVQQLLEGLVWTAGAAGETHKIAQYSLAYMFFAWLVWPVWVPISTYFLESSGRRRALYLAFAVAGGMIGALQYVPYFAHNGWCRFTFQCRTLAFCSRKLHSN